MTIFFPNSRAGGPTASTKMSVWPARRAPCRSFKESATLSGIRESLLIKFGGPAVVASGRLVQKQALPLAEILDKHRAPNIIDYAAFDIEGSELEVLRVFPFSRYSFRALSLECDGAIHDPITRLLTGAGYREVRNPFNRTQPWERYWLHGDMR